MGVQLSRPHFVPYLGFPHTTFCKCLAATVASVADLGELSVNSLVALLAGTAHGERNCDRFPNEMMTYTSGIFCLMTHGGAAGTKIPPKCPTLGFAWVVVVRVMEVTAPTISHLFLNGRRVALLLVIPFFVDILLL